MIVYHLELTILRCSSGTIATCPVFPKKTGDHLLGSVSWASNFCWIWLQELKSVGPPSAASSYTALPITILTREYIYAVMIFIPSLDSSSAMQFPMISQNPHKNCSGVYRNFLEKSSAFMNKNGSLKYFQRHCNCSSRVVLYKCCTAF